MNEKLNQYLNGVFAPYEGVKSVAELKADLLSDLQERFRELKAEGKDAETAFAMTIDSIGDIEQTVQETTHWSGRCSSTSAGATCHRATSQALAYTRGNLKG